MSKTDIKSPCILVCSIDMETGHCFGCGRDREEIAEWARLSHQQRDEIMNALPERLTKIKRRPRRVTKRRRMAQTKANKQ